MKTATAHIFYALKRYGLFLGLGALFYLVMAALLGWGGKHVMQDNAAFVYLPDVWANVGLGLGWLGRIVSLLGLAVFSVSLALDGYWRPASLQALPPLSFCKRATLRWALAIPAQLMAAFIWCQTSAVLTGVYAAGENNWLRLPLPQFSQQSFWVFLLWFNAPLCTAAVGLALVLAARAAKEKGAQIFLTLLFSLGLILILPAAQIFVLGSPQRISLSPLLFVFLALNVLFAALFLYCSQRLAREKADYEKR